MDTTTATATAATTVTVTNDDPVLVKLSCDFANDHTQTYSH